jgi:excisionase family DNA binding protein
LRNRIVKAQPVSSNAIHGNIVAERDSTEMQAIEFNESGRNEELFYTVDEAAAALRINRKSLYDAIARGEVPVIKVGRLFRIPGGWLRRRG